MQSVEIRVSDEPINACLVNPFWDGLDPDVGLSRASALADSALFIPMRVIVQELPVQIGEFRESKSQILMTPCRRLPGE
jgi:hypothetical protein